MLTPETIAWQVSESEYPAAGTDSDRLRYLVRYAVLAPSSHNTQPWFFRVVEDTVELYADRTRRLPVVDPSDRALTISCGAALLHLRLALRVFGRQDEVELLPPMSDPDLLVRVRLGAERTPTDSDRRLFAAIPHRHSNRRVFEPRPLPRALLHDLVGAAEAEGAWLHIARSEEERHAIACLVAEGDRIQAHDPAFRNELASWVHPNHSHSQDGMPGYAFAMSDLVSTVGPWVLRTFDWGEGQAAKDRQLAEGSPVLAVLGTAHDHPRDWLAAGQALARVLLTARAANVWASFLNQPVEVPELRPQLAERIGTMRFPQLILRMGYGPEVLPTPRRPLDAVLM